ncbi:MAG: phosphatidylserine decarboxylase family protein [Desulfobacterota bacterium]|nr:phosphatidylserine decarboxylase family protein [Thermodesulfobacteriota bacterium]MDW8002319.1 phosphatidylserine decarboxylase family protein [Deltaproteobacteria bacterium]
MKKIPVASEAKRVLFISLAIFFLSFVLNLKSLSIISVAFAIFILYFFRDPERVANVDSSYILSPADGKVMWIRHIDYEEFGIKRHNCISIFMSPFDVHVNRSPCDGLVKSVRYEPGKHFCAFKKDIETKNERNYIVLETHGEVVLLIQIAGFLARRIFSYVKEGEKVKRGDRIGMIAFGSRVDVCLPAKYEITVLEGQKVKAGITVIAKRRGYGEEKSKEDLPAS